MYTYVNNRFGTLQGMSSLLSGSARENTSSQLIMETDEVRDYVVENTPVEEGNLWRTLVIAVPNSTDYESNTVYCNGGPNIAICPPSEQAYPRDTRGIYRPEANSCMNYGIPYYNTPSRLAIYRRILDYAGMEFRMENFRAQDTFEWGATELTRAAASDTGSLTPITEGNHHTPTIINYREVGEKVRLIREKLKVRSEK